MGLSSLEKETIFIFNEEDEIAEVFTYNKNFKDKLNLLVKKFPDKFFIKAINKDGSIKYEIPKQYITIKLK